MYKQQVNVGFSFGCCVLTGFTLELSLSVAQTGAAHHVTIVSMAVPLLTDTVVITTVVTPL